MRQRLVLLLVSGLFLASCGGSASLPSPRVKHGPGFAAALAEWKLAPYVVGSFRQGLPLLNAISDLQVGRNVTDTGTKGYARAISELRTLSRLPDAMLSSADVQSWRLMTRQLDAFFGTPRLSG